MKPVTRKRSRVHRKPLTSLIIPLLVLQGESEEADFPRDEDLYAARFKLQHGIHIPLWYFLSTVWGEGGLQEL